MEYMTSAKARKLTEESTEVANKVRLDSIEAAIKVACKTDKFYIYEYSTLSASVINHLKNRGFRVEDLSSQKEGATYKITW